MKISTDYSIEPLSVTGEHPLYVLPNPDNHVYSTLKNKIDNKTTEVSYIDAKDVCVGDYLVYSIPTYEQDVSHITDEDCSMYGILLNYGNLETNKKEYTISIPNKINDSESKVNFCKSYFEKKSVICTIKPTSDITTVHWKPTTAIPFRYSDIYNNKNEKYISPIWINLPLEKMRHILTSIFSTFNYETNESFYRSTSRVFIEGLRYMMLRIGSLSKCKIQQYNSFFYSTQPIYYCIKEPTTIDTALTTQNTECFIHDKKIFSKVNSIERSTYDGTLYDLQMPTVHNYMIHNGVVHNGGGKRNGSFAIYLEPWHSDIEIFLQMRKNHGDEELKARDLFYALWTPDLFMQRVKASANWTLFCPSECPGLSDVYGKEFETLYTKYENEGKGRKTMPARDLWFQILDAQMETGTPYLLYKDAANEKSNQKNLGTIKSSNLCVAPETLVLTDVGQFPICSLWAGNYPECEQEKRQYTNVWNGETFSRVEVKKTATCNTEFVKVRTNDGECLTCTPYHKFYIVQNGETKEVQASDLQSGMTLETCFYPVIDSSNNDDCEHISKRHDAEHLGCMSGMKNMALNGHNLVTDPPIFVPINHSLKTKLDWFAGFIEPFLSDIEFEYEDLVEVPSRSIVLLQDIKHMLQTCGVNVIVNILQKEDHPDLCSMHIRVGQIKQLMQRGMEFKIPYIKTTALTVKEFEYTPTVQIVDVETIERIDDTYCFTEPLKHAGIFNGIRTGQCTEIIEYSDDKETAVCNLASIALPAFIRKPNTPEEESRTENGLIFDYEMLHEVTKVVTGNLNRIIDVNYYPTEKTRVSNMRHRPIGIGIQGLADVFLQLGWTFSSAKSRQLNKQVFETCLLYTSPSPRDS